MWIPDRFHAHDVPIVMNVEMRVFAAGMKDVGLYRVSGVLSEIQKLKKAFEKSEKLTFTCC